MCVNTVRYVHNYTCVSPNCKVELNDNNVYHCRPSPQVVPQQTYSEGM